MHKLLLLLVLLLPQEAEVAKLARELNGASLDRRDEITAALIKLGKPAVPALRKEMDAGDANLKNLLAGVIAEIEVAPLRDGVRVLTMRGDSLVLVDVATGKDRVIAKGVNYCRPHPKDREKLLVGELENLVVVDFTGKRTVIANKPKIVHPGCGHIESALHGGRWIQGGDAILFSWRDVPKGVDPHEESEDQIKTATVGADGKGLTLLAERVGLHSDYHNIGTPDFSPDAMKSIVSSVTKKVDNGADVELSESTFGKKGMAPIAKLELRSLGYLGGEWSPDSSKYFFFHSHDKQFDLYLWDGATTTKVEQENGLDLGGTGGYCLAWSPDSAKVAWLPHRKGGKAHLAVLELKTRKVTRFEVEHKSGPELGLPVWNAESSVLVTTSHRCPMETFHQHRFVGCKPALYAFDLATEKTTLLVEEGVSSRACATSPDPSYVYFWRPMAGQPKGKGDLWDEYQSQTFDLHAVHVKTGAVLAVTKSRAFPNLYQAEFLLPKR